MKKVIGVFFAFALISVPVRADKWAVGTFHTNQPLERVFQTTAKLMGSKEWYIGTKWHIQSIDKQRAKIHAITVSWGEYWGDIYVSMAAQGTGTSIEAVMTLHSGAVLHPANYEERFAKALKKLFPDLTVEIKRDVTPENFTFGVDQVSIPLAAADAPVVQPMQDSAANLGTTVIQEPMPVVIASTPGVQAAQSSGISPAQANSIDNSLQSITASLSQQTTGITPFAASSVLPMQNYAPAQIQQTAEITQQVGDSLMIMGTEQEIIAARNEQQADEVAAQNAVNQFLSKVNPVMNRYLATSGSEATGQFEMTARAINQARDEKYVMLADPTQKTIFTRVTNEYMLILGKQMGDHVRQQASINRETDEAQYTENLHRALDSWYANGKDWSKIPPEMWNKLSERDKGRLKDGIDPETINIRGPHPEHPAQP